MQHKPIIKYASIEITPKVHEMFVPDGEFGDFLLGSKLAQSDLNIRERFVKFSNALRTVAPKAKDFLYFSAVMMHAAEAALIDQNTGEIKTGSSGPIGARWDVNKKSGSWKWACDDSNLRPYKNNNGDIFPESELKKAYRKWVGRPLCKDHQSSSVDGIRGIIVDTFYDDKFKRVIALCALDKINYPDLARKVSTGYATNVSMGTAVGKSICFECGNVAQVEADYCKHVTGRSTYGEINIDLSPIELSLVVTGADPKAKLRHVIASISRYSDEKKARIDELKQAGCVTPGELERLAKEVEQLRDSVHAVSTLSKRAETNTDQYEQARNLGETLKNVEDVEVRKVIEQRIAELLGDESTEGTIEPPYGMTGGNKAMTGGKGGIGQDTESSGPPGYAFEGRNTTIASDQTTLEIKGIYNKLDALELALHDLKIKGVHKTNLNTYKEDQMSDTRLLERAQARRAMLKNAYHQGGGGVNDPGALPYPVDPDNDKLKTTGDKQMDGQGLEPGSDGLHPGYKSYGDELALKKKLSRAQVEERKLRRHALLSEADEFKNLGKNPQGATAIQGPDGKVQMFTQNDADGSAKSRFEFPLIASDGTILNNLGEYREYVEEKSMMGEKPTFKRVAYFQGGGGVNEPQTYPVDLLNDSLKTNGDKQMEGQGMESGSTGMHPGYQSTGPDEALKKKLLRADQKLRAKFSLAFKDDNKKVLDKGNSKWEIYAGATKILEATGREIFEDQLDENWEVLASKRYGREVLRAVREEGLERVAYLLKGEGFTKTAEPPMPEAPMMGGAAALPEAPPAPGGEGEDLGEGDDPVESTLSSLTEHLEGAEKALGDLKDALQETTGETEADLPSTAQVEPGAPASDARGPDGEGEEEEDADDSQFADDGEQDASDAFSDRVSEVYSALDESADELALLAESIETRVKAGKGVNDAVVAELLRLSKTAMDVNVQLRTEAAMISEAAKKDDDDKDDKKSKKGKLPPWLDKDKKSKEDDKDDKKSKESKKSKEDDKKSKEDDKKSKESKKSKEDDKDDKKEKKSKAELMLENLLQARAAKRRELARTAMPGEEAEMYGMDGSGDELVELKEMVDAPSSDECGEELAALKAKVDALLSAEHGEDHGEPDSEGGGFEGGGFEVGEEGGEEDALDAQLAQLLDEAADDLYADDNDGEEEANDGLGVSAAQRRAWRERVAAEAAGTYEGKRMDLGAAVTSDTDMPLGQSAQLGQLSIKPSEDGAKVEGLEEQHNKFMQQIQKLPAVREAVKHMLGLMKSGALSASDLNDEDKLQALAVDPVAAKYYKDYFGQADKESKAFATELTKEYGKKKAQASLDEQKIKMRRAFSMGLEMQEKGMIPDGTEYLNKQVDEIMDFDDKSFESMKRALARINIKKTASAKSPALQVGVVENNLTDGEVSDVPTTLVTQLKKMW